MKLLYFDYFHASNSNYFWRDAFSKYGNVETVHANVHGNLNGISAQLERAIERMQPDHLHLGGSIKSLKVIPRKALEALKEKGCRITWFYGDAYNNSVAQNSLLDVVDNIYITNASHLKHQRAIPVICPYDPALYRPFESERKHDLVFVGNPHTADRAKHVEELSKKFDLHVYGGAGWRRYRVNYKGALAHKSFSHVLSQYKIALGEPARAPCEFIGLKTGCMKSMPMFKGPVCRAENCKEYKGLKQYYSNRLANVLASKVCHLVYYVDGVEDILENEKNVVWYKNHAELHSLIDKYVKDDAAREQIASNGYDFIKNYTFDALAKRMLDGEKESASL